MQATDRTKTRAAEDRIRDRFAEKVKVVKPLCRSDAQSWTDAMTCVAETTIANGQLYYFYDISQCLGSAKKKASLKLFSLSQNIPPLPKNNLDSLSLALRIFIPIKLCISN